MREQRHGPADPHSPRQRPADQRLYRIAPGRHLQPVVFGISAWDPLTLGAVAGSLTVVAALATLVPAYRASRVDP